MACAYIILARSKRIGPLHCTCQWFVILGAATHWSDLVVSLGRRTIFAPSRRVKHRPFFFFFFCLFFVLFIALIVNATLVKMRLFAVHEVLQRNIKMWQALSCHENFCPPEIFYPRSIRH